MTVLLLEVAGIAGVHPAVLQGLLGRLLVLVVAKEHAAGPRHHLADPVGIGVVDAHLGGGEGHADGVEIDIVRLVDGVGATQLGLAVELAQRHAHGEKELEGVRPQGRAAGGRRAQVAESETVLQRPEEQPVGQLRLPLAFGGRLLGQLHAEIEHPLLEGRSVHHLRLDVGGDALPDPRRQQHEIGPDLAQVGHHRLRLLDEVDDLPADQRLRHGIDLLHDPGQGQHRDIVVGGILRVVLQVVETVLEHRSALQHRQFRIGGGARGGAENGDILRPPGGDQFVVETGLLGIELVPQPHQLGVAEQPRVVVLAHAARIAVDDMLDAGALLGDLQHLVDLFLVLGDDDLRSGVVDQVGDLLVEGILVDAEDHRPQRVRGDLAGHPFGPVVADDADGVALADAELVHAESEAPHHRLVVGPGEGVPDAELLFAQGDLVRPVGGVVGQQLGKGIVTLDVGVFGFHQATSPAWPWRPSSTSSSPR